MNGTFLANPQTHTKWYLLGLIGSLLLLAIAYFYFQLHLELVPCPLCIFQRVALVLVAFWCFLGLLHRPKSIGKSIYAALITLSSGSGIGIAGRQVWLQHLPADQVPECGIDPIYRWSESVGDDFGLIQMIMTVLKGSGDCAEIDWVFLGLSIGGWMLVIFSAMTLFSLVIFIQSLRQTK